MNKVLIIIMALFYVGITNNSSAQDKKNIKKEVKMEDENGIKTLTITTHDGDKITEEVFKGEEAEKKLAEVMEQHGSKGSNEKEIKKEVKVDEVNGEKILTVVTTENGKEKKEVFRGEEAEMKLKELESGANDGEAGKVVIKEKKVIKKSSSNM